MSPLRAIHIRGAGDNGERETGMNVCRWIIKVDQVVHCCSPAILIIRSTAATAIPISRLERIEE
jgi:hypothetical protein